MDNSKYTEEELAEIVDKYDDEFGMMVALWIKKHKTRSVSIKVDDPDGTSERFVVLKISGGTDEAKESQSDIQELLEEFQKDHPIIQCRNCVSCAMDHKGKWCCYVMDKQELYNTSGFCYLFMPNIGK